ncbi:uncharacterized protein [Dermacentor andersoni]|uniref:uncharacterized protein n=1 Tax=Dermacentor andersoni TaxID=34620 RepID=UPI003B3A307B
MPDHGQGRVHRFRDHVVAGVNWRPTRFVDEFPSSRVCGLCRTIPKRTVLLPCGHILCQTCNAASLEGGVGQCPLDQVQFEEVEGVGYEFPTRIANTLKVYCWNEENGCEYTGTMDRVLEHYENECTFHTVECLRCGEGVQHKDLVKHYLAGCTARVYSAITQYPSSEPTALTLEDVNAAFEELKAVLGDANDGRLLPVILSELNELTQQVRRRESRFACITGEIGASECNSRGDAAEMSATISTATSEASTSSSRSSHSEKALILRKLEYLAVRSLSTLEHLRQTSAQPDSSGVIAHCEPSYPEIRRFDSARITDLRDVFYDLTLQNCDEIIQWQGPRKKFAEITVWHMRDTYFTIAVWRHRNHESCDLTVKIEFNGMLVDSRCWPPFWSMMLFDDEGRRGRSLTSCGTLCCCRRYDDSVVHFHLEFRTDIASLENDGYIRDGKIMFVLLLSCTKRDSGIRITPERFSSVDL